MASEKNKFLKIAKILNIAWGLGFQIAIPAIFLAIIGVFLDKVLKTRPIITTISILAGPIIGLLIGIKEIKEIKKIK